MEKSFISRRHFFTRIAPACAGACMLNSALLANTMNTKDEPDHKFNKKMDEAMTYYEEMKLRYQNLIWFYKELEGEMGKEKLIDFLKKNNHKNSFARGQNDAKKDEKNDLKTYVRFVDIPYFENRLSFTKVENTDVAFEIKVTECIWAKIFREMGAGDLGYASVCYGDYGHAEGYNKDIKLIRDKTIMEGHNYCNHRYVTNS